MRKGSWPVWPSSASRPPSRARTTCRSTGARSPASACTWTPAAGSCSTPASWPTSTSVSCSKSSTSPPPSSGTRRWRPSPSASRPSAGRSAAPSPGPTSGTSSPSGSPRRSASTSGSGPRPRPRRPGPRCSKPSATAAKTGATNPAPSPTPPPPRCSRRPRVWFGAIWRCTARRSRARCSPATSMRSPSRWPASRPRCAGPASRRPTLEKLAASSCPDGTGLGVPPSELVKAVLTAGARAVAPAAAPVRPSGSCYFPEDRS